MHREWALGYIAAAILSATILRASVARLYF